MGVDITDAKSSQRVLTDKTKNLVIRGDACLREALKRVQYGVALAQIAQRQFPGYEGMRKDASGVEQLSKAWIAMA